MMESSGMMLAAPWKEKGGYRWCLGKKQLAIGGALERKR